MVCALYHKDFVHFYCCSSFLLLILMRWSSFCMMISQKISNSPVFNNAVTLFSPKDSAKLLHGWKQRLSKCLLYRKEWSVGFRLSCVSFNWSSNFFLTSGRLGKAMLSYCLDNSETTNSSITLHMLYHIYAPSTQVCVAVSHVHHS